jgi:hypothetical protein
MLCQPVRSLCPRGFQHWQVNRLRSLRQAALRPYAIQEAVAPSSQFLRRPAFRVGLLRPRRWQEHARHVPAVRTLIRDQAGVSGTRRDSHYALHHGPASRAYWTSVPIGAGTSAFRLNARHPIRSANQLRWRAVLRICRRAASSDAADLASCSTRRSRTPTCIT